MVNPSSKTFPKKKKKEVTRVNRPFKTFIAREALSGVILIASVVLALFLANSAFSDTYMHWWEVKLGIFWGSFSLEKDAHLWINDLLMAMFFLLVGLEIKRELLIGELSSTKRAMFPAIAAIGGMLIPALFYFLINPIGSAGVRGWAIPMATDIAFALGILFLLGKRVPSSIRVFLASLAIVDDIGAVLIIAFFYSETIIMSNLAYAGLIVGFLIILNKLGINRLGPYLFLGLVLWYLVFLSGIHATIAGVILAFTIPATTKIDFQEFGEISTTLVNQMNSSTEETGLEGRKLKIYQNSLLTLEKACENVQAPLQKLEHSLAPFVTFIIMPLFAFSNAGVVLDIPFGTLITNRIVLGITFGLIIGKPLGIFGFTYLADRIGLIEKPKQLTWLDILGTGFLAGIGFTMSIFISVLAFPAVLYPAGVLIAIAKTGILVSSTLSALIGIGILLYSSNKS